MKPFSLLVKPASADCNLRCTYCFYLEKKDLFPETPRLRMSDETLEKMISSYMSIPMQQYSIGWQGGEPTMMGLDFFKKVVHFEQKYGRPGAMVSNGLQTNTTMINDEWAEFLGQYNFLVGVSLDGMPEIHNHYRKYGDGHGSHADVMRGIESMKRYNVDFNILTLVNNINVKKPLEIYNYMKDQGFNFQQYIECVEFDKNGKLLPYAVNAEEWGDFLCTLFDEWYEKDTKTVSIRLFDAILNKMVNGSIVCCPMGNDCRHYFVVEHNGDIYPCDFYVEKDLKLGNINTGTWQQFYDNPVYTDFGLRKANLADQCKQCEYLYLCQGDCQKNRFGNQGSLGVSLMCPAIKKFYKHTMPRFLELRAGIVEEQKQHQEAEKKRRVESRIKENNKPGRNDSCPCGSGKKFKNCCGKATG
jgi:uncharacterized protein